MKERNNDFKVYINLAMKCQTEIAKILVLGSHADCSDCSCENCHDFENEGPNQVNLMATQNNNDAAIGNLISSTGKAAAHEANDDIHKELSRVLGALESRTVDRKTRKDDLESLEEEKPNISPNVALQQVDFYSFYTYGRYLLKMLATYWSITLIFNFTTK